MPGIISFFENDVPKAFDKTQDAKLAESFRESNARVVQSLKRYQLQISDKFAKSSVSAFALGKDNFEKKLRFEEMIETPSDELLIDSYKELHRVQDEFKTTARAIDPSIEAPLVLAKISKKHPSADELLLAIRESLKLARSHCESLVTLPASIFSNYAAEQGMVSRQLRTISLWLLV